MTLVVLGIDALDPELVDPGRHPSLTLDRYKAIDTINSTAGEPSTHELWPTIITGLPPEEHGLILDNGVAWESPALRYASQVADWFLPDDVQSSIGAWFLNNTGQDAFRTPADYYPENGLSTVFDNHQAKPIGIPNYVVDPEQGDREHQLRQTMGDLFERDQSAVGGHISSDPEKFYEQCMEMLMIRIARVRRGLRHRQHELVFGYTSGLDLVGHVAYDRPELQENAYEETDEFVGELIDDLNDSDTLFLVSDHGLQNGLHTEEAMIASTDGKLIQEIESVLDVRKALDHELKSNRHLPTQEHTADIDSGEESEAVKEQLENLGYM